MILNKTPYTLGIDGRMLTNTGIGTYLRGLLHGFEQTSLHDKMPNSILFGSADICSIPYFTKHTFNTPIYTIQEQIDYINLVSKCRLWHSPHYNIPLIKGKTKLVTTIHDIIHWIYRDKLSLKQKLYARTMLYRAVKVSDHIIAVSEHTKNDLVEYFNANPNKITVIHESVRKEDFSLPESERAHIFDILQEDYSLPTTFFLYVGLLKQHKNVDRLIRNYLSLRSQNKLTSKLVIVGKKPDAPEIRALLDEGVEKGEVFFLEGIRREELIALYSKALALVHPSKYEGFGLTLLEAMVCQTPVLSSNAASLPEVGGDAVLYMDPDSDESISKSLIEMESSETLRNELVDKAQEQLNKFSWEKTAAETLEVYEKTLYGKKDE